MDNSIDVFDDVSDVIGEFLIDLNQTIMKSIVDLENLENFLKKEELDQNILQDSLNFILLSISNFILILPEKQNEINWPEYSTKILKKLNLKNGLKKYYLLQICYVLENLNKKIYHQIFKIEILQELFEDISLRDFRIDLGEFYIKYSPNISRSTQ